MKLGMNALSSNFRDTKCIVSFQINPHWISNSGLWKVVSTRDISKRPGKLTKGVMFHQGNAPAHKSVVAMAAVRDCGFKLVDHPPYCPDLAAYDYFLFPNMKKTHGWEAVSDRWWGHICSWGPFRGSGWELLYHRNSSATTPTEEVSPQGRLCCKINHAHLVKFDHCITFSLWTFQPTLVYVRINNDNIRQLNTQVQTQISSAFDLLMPRLFSSTQCPAGVLFPLFRKWTVDALAQGQANLTIGMVHMINPHRKRKINLLIQVSESTI